MRNKITAAAIRRGYGWDQANDETGDYPRYYYPDRNRQYRNRAPRQTGYSRDYGRNYGEYTNRDYNRRGAYPAAGMGADYGGRTGYDDQDDYDEDINYGEGDVGYESEGAFYQDMDEPINYENQDYRYGRGMGPQGYQRSDERITEDVCERLTRHGRVDASDIEIAVQNGEVFLKGTVPDRQMKRMAEDAAEGITGVKDVHNDIKVEQQQRVRSWESRQDRQQNRDWENQQSSRGWETRQNQTWESRQSEQPNQDWKTDAENSPAGQSNIGAGFESEGTTSMEGLESIEQRTPNPTGSMDEFAATTQVSKSHRGVREGMEVIGSSGRVVGRVKEIRDNDFLVDREMARDIYVPYSAIASVGEQILLHVSANEVDNQGWEKPAIL
jgi:sporulation protein YlmC with PRC-barrel domain